MWSGSDLLVLDSGLSSLQTSQLTSWERAVPVMVRLVITTLSIFQGLVRNKWVKLWENYPQSAPASCPPGQPAQALRSYLSHGAGMENGAIIPRNILSAPFSLSFLSSTPIMHMLVCLMISTVSETVPFLHSFLFLFFRLHNLF